MVKKKEMKSKSFQKRFKQKTKIETKISEKKKITKPKEKTITKKQTKQKRQAKPKKQKIIKPKKQIEPREKEEQIDQIDQIEKETSILKKNKTKKSTKLVRVPTGITSFDSLVEGGFEKNSTNLLVGSSGAGKSIFSIQFLMNGLKKGEKVLYVTFEEKKEEVFGNMKRFGWDLEKLEKQGKFIFLEYTPEKVRTMLEEGGGIIENIVLTKKVTRMVIDSITSFELLFEKELQKRESALELFNLIRRWNVTSLLTYEGSPNTEKKETSRILDFESDSIILLYFVRGKDKRNRFLEVLKMRGTAHSLDIFPFSIDKAGIVINKKKYKGDFFQ